MNWLRLVIIGTGRAASALGGRWSVVGHEVVWWSRRDGRIEDAPTGDVVVLAVPDAVVGEVAGKLAQRGWAANEVWLHLSGVHAAGVLRGEWPYAARSVGCLHPLVALAPGADPAGAIAGIEGEIEAVAFAEKLAHDIGLVPHAIPADRALYHAAAVSVAGHATALFAQAMSLMQTAGFSREAARDALRPLLASAVGNLARGMPEAVITGPVSRGDDATVKRHLDALAAHGDAEVLAAYKVLARAALRISSEAIGVEAAARLRAMLE